MKGGEKKKSKRRKNAKGWRRWEKAMEKMRFGAVEENPGNHNNMAE